MNTRIATVVAILSIVFPITALGETEWALAGDWAESCCCQAACPCVFGSAPTKGHCDGSALFEIRSGKLGDTKVDGLTAMLTYRFGEWIRVYVDDDATDEQVDAVATLMNQPTTFGGLFAGADLRSVEKADITISKDDSKIAFSVEDSKVELEPMKGPNGEVMRIENLAIPWFINGYEQYVATTTTHKRDGTAFEYEGTNGALSHVDAKGTIE